MFKYIVFIFLFLTVTNVIANDDLKRRVNNQLNWLGYKTQDVNETAGLGDETKVMALLSKFDSEGVIYLLENGYDKNLKNRRGETAYDFAVKMKYDDPGIIELLKPNESYSGIYDLTKKENNIANVSSEEAINLYKAGLKKKNCNTPFKEKLMHEDINRDGVKDLLYVYSTLFCEGRSSSAFVSYFKAGENDKFDYITSKKITGISYMKEDSVRVENDSLYLTGVYRKPGDAFCCPSGEKLTIFGLMRLRN